MFIQHIQSIMFQYYPDEDPVLSWWWSSTILAVGVPVHSWRNLMWSSSFLAHCWVLSGRVLSSLPCWQSSPFLVPLCVNQFIPGTQYSLKVEIATRYLYSIPLRLVKRSNGLVQWLLSLGDRDQWLLVCSYRSNGYWYPVKNTLLGRVWYSLPYVIQSIPGTFFCWQSSSFLA